MKQNVIHKIRNGLTMLLTFFVLHSLFSRLAPMNGTTTTTLHSPLPTRRSCSWWSRMHN